MTSIAKIESLLPPFTAEGVLPPADYPLTIDQLKESHLVTGSGCDSENWDRKWRLQLVHNLDILVTQLLMVGIEDIFIDGSFVEDKDHPNDIDGYFVCPDLKYFASRQMQRDLNEIDPFKCWTWDLNDRVQDPNSAKLQLPMWHRYKVELYAHHGQDCGIKDKFGNAQRFPAAFRKSRIRDLPKGIIKIIG